MVGHTGDLNAAKKAVEAMDLCIGKIIESTRKVNGSLIITADHGNAELMMDVKNNQSHTQHTTNLVPFIVMNSKVQKIVDGGKLSDIAPTLLSLLNCDPPQRNDRKKLIQFKNMRFNHLIFLLFYMVVSSSYAGVDESSKDLDNVKNQIKRLIKRLKKIRQKKLISAKN